MGISHALREIKFGAQNLKIKKNQGLTTNGSAYCGEAETKTH